MMMMMMIIIIIIIIIIFFPLQTSFYFLNFFHPRFYEGLKKKNNNITFIGFDSQEGEI